MPRCSLGRALALMILASPSGAQVKLNGPLERVLVGGVQEYKFTPDATTLLYVSDENTDEIFELFAVPADGSAAPVLVSGNIGASGVLGTPGGDLLAAFEASVDSSAAYFIADATGSGTSELYRAAIDGSGTPLVLASPQAASGNVRAFALAPDGATVLVFGDLQLDERFELFRVPADGSAPPSLLSMPMSLSGDVQSMALEGERVYYLADAIENDVFELFSRPVDASLPNARLNLPLSGARDVVSFRVSPDGERVVYRADSASDNVFELFGAPSDGSGPPVTLNRPLLPGGNVGGLFEIAPDGQRVAFLADHEGDGTYALHIAPLDGSAAAVELYSLPSGGVLESGLLFPPDSSSILFVARAGASTTIQRVLCTGGGLVTLASAGASSVDFPILKVSPDGTTCVYANHQQRSDIFFGTGSQADLYAVPVAGGSPVRLTNEPLLPSVFTSGFGQVEFFADGTRIAFTKDHVSGEWRIGQVRTDGSELSTIERSGAFRLSPDGNDVAFVSDSSPDQGRLVLRESDGTYRLLSGPTLDGPVLGDVTKFETTPDGLQVLYWTGSEFSEDLFVTGSGGGGAPRSLPVRGRRSLGGTATISPASDGVVFASTDFEGMSELYYAPVRSGGGAVAIGAGAASREMFPEHSALAPLFTPDGERVVFARGIDDSVASSAEFALYVVPRLGSDAPTRLNGTGSDRRLWSGGDYASNKGRGFALTKDGARVVYSASSPGSRQNLFSVPLDGSAAPVQLSQLAVAGRYVYGNWEITPDGSRVVYMTDQDVPLTSELYSVPVDGSAPPIQLNPALPPGGNVGYSLEGVGLQRYARLTPDGRAVYLADQEVSGVRELFSVPVDGSASSVKLSGALTMDGDVLSGFLLTPDGTHVVYMADAVTNETFELFVAPVDGSASPSKLSGTLVAGGDVSLLGTFGGLASGGVRFVYTADALVDQVFELFSVPIDGSSPPVRLSGSLVAEGDVTSDVLVTPDGATVIYRADGQVDEEFELFRVPIDGSAAPVRLNPPLPVGGDVQPGVRILANGRRVVWRADQEVDEQFELFSLPISSHAPKGPAVPPGISGTVTRQL